jgi:hypothetical protein
MLFDLFRRNAELADEAAEDPSSDDDNEFDFRLLMKNTLESPTRPKTPRRSAPTALPPSCSIPSEPSSTPVLDPGAVGIGFSGLSPMVDVNAAFHSFHHD